MKYQVFLLPRARKDLEAFTGKLFSRLRDTILTLSKNARPASSIKLTGDGGYRIRVGDFRILYRVDDKEKKVFVYRIRHRREAYR